jgi:hypothetical protein
MAISIAICALIMLSAAYRTHRGAVMGSASKSRRGG